MKKYLFVLLAVALLLGARSSQKESTEPIEKKTEPQTTETKKEEDNTETFIYESGMRQGDITMLTRESATGIKTIHLPTDELLQQDIGIGQEVKVWFEDGTEDEDHIVKYEKVN